MNKWECKTPCLGDHIRVNRGYYYHHGIYCDDKTIIQFGSTTQELDPTRAEVMIIDLQGFLKGGVLEVRVYSEEENKTKRTPMDIVNYAFTQLGRRGYDLVSNNCEHFANECVFGKAYSDQVDNISSILGQFFRR